MNRRYLIAVMLVVAGGGGNADALTKPAAKKSDGRLFLSVEHFQWKEYVDGDEILEESGPIFGLGGEITTHLSKTLELGGRGRVFFGQVDYDGAIFAPDGSSTPYESDSLYGGLEVEGDLGRPFPTKSGIIWKPFFGLGLRYWQRTLDTSVSDDDIGDYGYEEDWTSIFAVFGVEIRRHDFFGRLALRAPLNNQETVDLSEQGGPEIELEPGEEVSFSGEFGMNFKRYFAALYFETLEFSESDLDDDTELFYQPESKARIIGIRGGMNF